METVLGVLLLILAFKFMKKIGKLVFTLILVCGVLMLAKGVFGISLIALGMNLLGL